jgi:hypothetical protein
VRSLCLCSYHRQHFLQPHMTSLTLPDCLHTVTPSSCVGLF